MISSSSTTPYKLKSKGYSRDAPDLEYTNSDESGDHDAGEKYFLYSRERGGRNSGANRNRTRATEFRASKAPAANSRSTFRGRREPHSRRNDRDYSDGYYTSRKYESSSRSDNYGGYRGGKCYEPDKKSEIKLNLPEDTRISKLLRRLNIETNPELSLQISKKLLDVLLLPDNSLYVRKAFHILSESMYEILHVAPGPMAKEQAARALGRMGYIMGQECEFDRYHNWLFSKMSSTYEEMQILLMATFKETFRLEVKKPILEEHVANVVNHLVAAIEVTDNVGVFKAILETLVTIVEIYPNGFYNQFRDTTDLLFGWHVDHKQPIEIIEFISRNMQRLSHHFKFNMEFSVSLMENFLEDIVNFGSDLNVSDNLDHVTVLILALNTLLKCLHVNFHPNNNKWVTVDFVVTCLTTVIKTLTDALDTLQSEDLVIAANECICLLLPNLDTKSQTLCSSIYNVVELELTLINDFQDNAVISMLLLISRVMKELSANLRIELIEKLIGPKSEILKLRSSPYANIQNSVICVYQALLNLKNVSLLQEAYRYILGDFERFYIKIVPKYKPTIDNNPFVDVEIEEDPELTIMFLLRCLSQLVNASSIIVMWALKPSILELVGVNLRLYDPILAKRTPYIQYSLLHLLFAHCKCYNHFILNSSLVATNKQDINRFAINENLTSMNDVPSSSPNSGNFAVILDVLYKCLKVRNSTDVSLLLLQWLYDILNNAKGCLEVFYLHEKFTLVTDVLVKYGYNFNVYIVEAVCDNLEKLLENDRLAWSDAFLRNVSDLCKLHMTSNSGHVRDRYSQLSAYIPWDIAIVEFNKVDSCNSGNRAGKSNDFNSYMIRTAQNLHLNGSVDSEFYAEPFKKFMRFLLTNNKNGSGSGFLENLFTTCWTQDCDSRMNMELFYDLAMSSRQVLTNWCTFEAAQFCVNYKLRTPLGKPNETFMKIESALNQLGNDLIAVKKNSGGGGNERSSAHRVRMLLRFVEHLEKSIYNASVGCAVAMQQPVKVVRQFFTANTKTCQEWLSRIRMVVMHVALHSGESGIALKHGHCLLKDLALAGKATTAEFERVAMFVSLALLNLKEPEALYGLFNWCKTQTGKRYAWIKCAADQACKRYEAAVEGYKKILQEAQTELDVDVCNFVQDQIVVCYKELNNWVDLFEWQSDSAAATEVSSQAENNGKKYWFHTNNWDCNRSLFDFEADARSLERLATWSVKDEESSWSVYENLTATETNLYKFAINLATEEKDDDDKSASAASTDKIRNSLKVIQRNIQELLPLAPSEFLQNYSLLQYVAIGLRKVAENQPAHTVFLVSESFEKEIDKVDTSVLRKILWWSEYFGRVQNQGFNVFSSNLRLDIIKRARKEKNFGLATSQMYKFFKDKNVEFSNDFLHVLAASDFIESAAPDTFCTLDMARAMSEVIKLCYSNEENRSISFNLCASISTSLSKWAERSGSIEHRTISSKILLKLAGWLQSNDQTNVADMNSPLGKLIMVLPEIGMMESTSTNVIPLNEMAVGKLLQFGAHQCPSLAKSWNAFGTWCYKWAKKIVDHSSSAPINLSDEHCSEVRALLPPTTSEEDIKSVCMILSQTRSTINNGGEEDIDSSEISTTDMIQDQLKSVDSLKDATEDQLKALVQIWKTTQKSIYNCYYLSAEAYFKYLHLAMNVENVSRSSECNTITVTLRLLRLIVKYALELQSILEEGLQATPTEPWKVIIPQLFSRLNHPESYVRLRVSDLLCRVAEDAPQLITFPAVVGALEGGLKFDFSEIKLPKDCLSQNNDDNEEENDLENEEDNYESDCDEFGGNNGSNTLQICFKTMVDTLSKQNPDAISQVQTLVKELRRITLLWDELWLGTLAQHQSEITKRQHQLEYEIEKVNENANLSKEEKTALIREKHRIIIKPIVYVLEQLNDVTKVEPETPHEKEFQEKYLGEINSVIEKLKRPDCPEKPQESLQPLKQLQKMFQQKFHKRTSYTLKMQDISPILHSIKNTLIAMPGLATNSKKNVTISHINNVVAILPTKTKPKKLVFYGSDGKVYTYLFKGLEDLHLDERIMQFLSIANTMMAQIADPAGNNLYRARHYSVIPLGPRSGLISWVDGTTPVFTLYKRWQQRELAKPTNAKSATATVPRPSELFYNKLVEHGVKNIDNRKEWPLGILKKVLAELMAETPSDLIAKELWCNAVSANSWWQVVKRYSYSVAVMSMIGYIIGLGDRHLDNVLIDLFTGDVVHIDYNVCFEKGKTLRVPEKVPFRLTPNIRDALGVTGVEGIFRLACENVLKTMRKGRETLLTLLEAFVYDPLIDWTVGGEVLAGTTFGGAPKSSSEFGRRQTKKELEREVTLAMFDVRCNEMKVEWQENKEEILNEIPTLTEHLNACLVLTEEIEEIEDHLKDRHQQLALVKEAEAQGPKKHSLYKLPNLYEAYVKNQEALNIARKGLCDIIKDSETHFKAFNQILTSFENQQLTQWLNELPYNVPEENLHIFDLVKEFLHNAGKDDVVNQCESSEEEVAQLALHMKLQIRKCVQLFQDYFNLLIQCPKSYHDRHRIKLYAKWSSYLLETKSPEGCDLIVSEFRNFVDSKAQNGTQIVATAFALDNLYKDSVLSVNKLYEELAQIKARDSTHPPEVAYEQARKSIESFLAQEELADRALKFVLAGKLLVLNCDFLGAEITAQKSGSWLINLTSRQGDWFLDDLLLYTIKAVELLKSIPLKQDEDSRLYQVTNGIKIASAVYKSLSDLNYNFHTIILPETMKKIQADEPSVYSMIVNVNRVIVDCDIPIQDIISELEKLLTCVMMHLDVQTTYDLVLEKVAIIRGKYLALIQTPIDKSSPGTMLLMGFNGLFEKISQEAGLLASTLGTLDVPKSWKKLDHVKEARNIAPHIFNSRIRTILENIFYLKRIVAVSDFFALAQQMCQGIKESASTMIFPDDVLSKPVKQFIAEFISRQVLGVTPEAIAYAICFLLRQLDMDVTHEIEQKDIGAENKVHIEELYHKCYSSLMKDRLLNPNVTSQASNLEENVKLAWEKMQESKKIEQKLAILKSTALRLQNQLTIHNLLFDEVLSLNNFHPFRAKFLLDLQSEVAILQATYTQLKQAKEKQQALIDKAQQRLNWAKGANPNVVEILAAFQNGITVRDDQLKIEQKIAGNVLQSANIVLKHEFLRTNNVQMTKDYDALFLNSCETWRRSCQYKDQKMDDLLPAEESILNMLSLDLIGNPRWLHQVAMHITEVISMYQKKLNVKKEELFAETDGLVSLVSNFKAIYNIHARLVLDVKSLLKIMTKIDDYSQSTQCFVCDYKKYTEHFNGLFNTFKDHLLDKEVIEEMLDHLTQIQTHSEDIYKGLQSLKDLKEYNCRPLLKRQPCFYANDRPKTESKVQQRNAYALNVWRRVKMKLEGRDPDPGRKCTAQEQVDYVIREATSIDNLALLYEGWTPWV